MFKNIADACQSYIGVITATITMITAIGALINFIVKRRDRRKDKNEKYIEKLEAQIKEKDICLEQQEEQIQKSNTQIEHFKDKENMKSNQVSTIPFIELYQKDVLNGNYPEEEEEEY